MKQLKMFNFTLFLFTTSYYETTVTIVMLLPVNYFLIMCLVRFVVLAAAAYTI